MTQSPKQAKRYLIETIQNIYSKQKTPSWPLIILKWFILLITTIVVSFLWFCLFSISPKKERNFCYSMKDNQLDSCSIEQICQDYDNQINIFIYEKGDWDKNDFYNETMQVNTKYAKFFVQIATDMYTRNVYSKLGLNASNQKLKGVVLLASREKYIIPLHYNSICEMKSFNIVVIMMFVLGGICGSVFLSLCSDIYGRKPIIIISLGIVSVSSLGFCVYFFVMDALEAKYKANGIQYTEFNEILQDYYAQHQISLLFKQTEYFVLALGFVMGFTLYPLKNCLLALLLENSLNDYFSLYSYQIYNCAECGLAPFFGMITAVLINDLRYALLFYSLFFILFFVLSFFLLYESMRHLFEYFEWEKLSLVAIKCLTDLKESDFCTEAALESHRVNSESFEKKGEDKAFEDPKLRHAMIIKQRRALTNSIKQNTQYSLKKTEAMKYPYLILLCLISNPLIYKSITSLLQLIPEFTFASYVYNFESTSIKFFTLQEIYDNIVVNSSFFLNVFIIYVSGFVYFCLWRIMTYKRVIIINGLFIFIFSLFYDLFSLLAPSPMKDLNRYNYTQMSLYFSEIGTHYHKNYLYVVIFFCNGIHMFQNLLLLKYSKTLFRCTFLGCVTAYQLIALLTVFFISLAYERLATFGGIAIVSMLLSVMYANQAGEEAYLISDVKRTLSADKKRAK